MNIQHEWQIRSAKITGKGTVDVTFTQDNEVDGLVANKEYKFKCDRVAHTALYYAFKNLLAHAMIIGERIPSGHKIDAGYFKSEQIHRDPKFLMYEITGFKLKGDDKGETISLSINQILHDGGTIKMELPFVKLYEGSSYDFSGNLKEDLEMAQQEVMDYIGGKYRESQQMKIDYDTVEDEAF